MEERTRAAIIGVGETAYRTRIPEANYPELAQQAALEALEAADMAPEDIDAIVFSMAPTEFMGVTDADLWAIDAVGGRGKPFMRVHTGGATGGSAAQAGYTHVASGMYEKVLVVGADKVAETPDAQFILNLIWDPFFERDFALNTVTMAAIQASRRMARYETTEEQMAAVAVSSYANAKNNPRAHLSGDITVEDVMESPGISWPLKRYDCCPRSSGAAAVVIASERVVRERDVPAAWINGVGAATNTVWMGDRSVPSAPCDLGDWDELRLAAKEAYSQAGITDPVEQIDVVELYAPFSINQILGVEALGLCNPGEGGRLVEEGFFDLDGAVPVNPSGGTLCTNPIAVTALVRVCDAALQVLGAAGSYQLPDVSTAVATGVGGSFQFQTCMVLSGE
ncbi:MAG: thiolase family protein [Rubrobacter sp.]|nr:thiolase family protein [Rubrobacter sp.]